MQLCHALNEIVSEAFGETAQCSSEVVHEILETVHRHDVFDVELVKDSMDDDHCSRISGSLVSRCLVYLPHPPRKQVRVNFVSQN